MIDSGSGVEFVEGSSGVKGRLKQCISYWESTICAPQFVLGRISEGYRLPFVRFPDKSHLRNNRSAVRHPQFVKEAISKLLLTDCIQEHCEPPLYCVNPLSVAEGKKLRLVIDLRHVNPCRFKHSFKYEDLRMHCLSKVFEQNFTTSIRSKLRCFLLQSPSFWLELRLFLLYEIAASFS